MKIHISYTLLIVLLFTSNIIYAQKKNKAVGSQYNRMGSDDTLRFYSDSLAGVFIPKDLNDCFTQISYLIDDSTEQEIKIWQEDEFTGKVHHSFGMWIRNKWQLWGGSRLSKYFNELGIYHPDDMSGIILTSYHRWLNDKQIELSEQVQFYQAYWAESKRQLEQNRKDDFAKNNIGDTVEFDYRFGYSSKRQEAKYDADECYPYGIITDKDSNKYQYKILLLESCDRRGIIYYDNKNAERYNTRTKEWSKPKRVIKYMKEGEELWVNFEYWTPYIGL